MDSDPMVIDPNPSFMKVVRNFDALDYMGLTSVPGLFALVGCAAFNTEYPDRPGIVRAGTLVCGLLGLLFKFSLNYGRSRDQLKGIPPSPPPPELVIRIPRTDEEFVIVGEESLMLIKKLLLEADKS